MKVFRPTKNKLTRGYSISHKGYDFAGLNLPDEVRAGKDGTIIQRIDRYVSSWTNTGSLTTRDYGNYIKVKHTDGTYELHAHLRKGSSFEVGTNVKAGQTIARIGNTGNSTGPHLHSEYRDAGDRNLQVEFYEDMLPDNYETIIKKATQWDETVTKLELGQPEHILSEAVINLIGGLKSSITAAQRERDEARIKAKNATEENSRLGAQVLILETERDGCIAQSKKLRDMNDEQGRVIGGLEEDIAQRDITIRELSKNVVTGLSPLQLIGLALRKALNG